MNGSETLTEKRARQVRGALLALRFYAPVAENGGVAATRQHLHELVDRLDAPDVCAVHEVVRVMVDVPRPEGFFVDVWSPLPASPTDGGGGAT